MIQIPVGSSICFLYKVSYDNFFFEALYSAKFKEGLISIGGLDFISSITSLKETNLTYYMLTGQGKQSYDEYW